MFKSGGIFPDFEEKLSIQKDYSLGFIRKTPENGFNIYDQLANYDNEIRLSNEGLKGSGSIEFYTSTAMSDDITFYQTQLELLHIPMKISNKMKTLKFQKLLVRTVESLIYQRTKF